MTHLSDEALIKLTDGEALQFETMQSRQHLQACANCRARADALEQTMSRVVTAHKLESAAELPPIDEARTRLQARLSQIQAASLPVKGPTRWPAFMGVAAGVLLVMGLVFQLSVQSARAALIPNTKLTPGATRPMTREDVCSIRMADGFYPIPATLAHRVFETYHIRSPRPRSYEVDYLISPALGGADDIQNLWPQPYADGEWNSHVKDALEDYLRDQVCQGRLSLMTAQQDISLNWIAAYKKYFQTDRPLSPHRSFVLDPAWEN